MTDWLAFSRACVRDLEDVLRALLTRDEREPVLRAGEGGDDTTAIRRPSVATSDSLPSPAVSSAPFM